MDIIRTRFARDIVAEVAIPRRPSGNVIMLLPGLPSLPVKTELLTWLTSKRYTVLFPRYRGTWESGGAFLRHSPERDVIDIMAELPRGVVSVESGQRRKLVIKKLFLLGSSFGGPAAILASRHPRVSAAVALSPVIDWTKTGPGEPHEEFEQYLRAGFGGAYRYRASDWQRLIRNKFYSPLTEAKTIRGEKLLLIHAKDDRVVPWKPTATFAEQTQSHAYIYPRGGHFGLSVTMQPELWKPISAFFER